MLIDFESVKIVKLHMNSVYDFYFSELAHKSTVDRYLNKLQFIALMQSARKRVSFYVSNGGGHLIKLI